MTWGAMFTCPEVLVDNRENFGGRTNRVANSEEHVRRLRTREAGGAAHTLPANRPISVYGLGEMPIQSCGQSFSAPRGKAGARFNAHTELRAKRQRSAREAIYRNRPITSLASCFEPPVLVLNGVP
jgi:hypothetical protein